MMISMSHHLPLYTAGQMRRTDANAIRGIGIPGAVLMDRAGMAVAEYLLEHFCDHHCFAILAGKGNNGGDGFVAARYLFEAGVDVQVFAAAPARQYDGDAAVNLKVLGKLGLKVRHMPTAASLRRALARDCVIVDAIFGTGFSGEPRGKSAEFIGIAAGAADRHGIPIVAVDTASGVDASSGVVASKTLPADTTVTFHVPKVGHFVAPGSYYSGDVILADIGIPAQASVEPDHYLTDSEQLAALIPPKMDYDNKFSVGRVLVVGGSTGLTGAPCLAAEAALRCGAGLVTAAVPAGLNAIFEGKLLEVMTLPLGEEDSVCLDADALDAIVEAAPSFDCLAIGPGLGRQEATAALVRKLLPLLEVPVVLDADGLNAFAGKPGALKKRGAPTVLTPHAGELGRLMAMPSAGVVEDSLRVAKAAARRSGAVVVLKGAHSISTDGPLTLINPTGNPGLATAGSGDVLTGIIAALLARGLPPLEAGGGGTYIHGAAGDLAAGDLGIDNMVSSDLLDFLPQAFAELEAD